MKPHIRKVGQLWECHDASGIGGFGLSPVEAFGHWLFATTVIGFRARG